ncbi:hypothetical protein DQW50_16340 [Halorubrum sp. 48-1-W]|uniref:hypothetical protein n=1 Tax=Halorubrum sp. 48-1-W TaxID=2249761 RepID=UPI000DCD1E02|nr:hypothetical protein [Halorubrum sp. 48-1-W]RAW44090.1 hypothetical protein DQW50_16340 [Halorubrum sp. 48-1-W]
MKPNQDQQERTHTNWIASMNDAFTTCRQVLMRASVDVSDPRRALWPAVPRSQMSREHQTVAQCHAAVLDYAEHIEPFRNRCSHAWTERIQPPHAFPDGSQLPVVLAELEEWADRRYEEPVGSKHELTGRKQDVELRRVHLPTEYARGAFRQLNKCREQLKLSADPPTPERTVDGPDDAW